MARIFLAVENAEGNDHVAAFKRIFKFSGAIESNSDLYVRIIKLREQLLDIIKNTE